MNARSLALASSSGLLLAACYPSVNLPVLAWISLIPLLIALRGQAPANAFLLGGCSGAVFFVGTIYWVANSLHVYGSQPLASAAFVTLLLCGYLALYPALFAAALAYLARRQMPFFSLAAASLWTSLELARTYALSGFPWSLLGYSQYAVLPVIQIADITGVYGVSFLIVLVNTALFEAMTNPKRLAPLVSAAIIMSLVLSYGWARLRSPDSDGGIRISVIQGNIDQGKKWDPAYQRRAFDVYQRLTREALNDGPDLVIWPETSTPFYFGADDAVDRQLSAELSAFVKTGGVPLLFGSPTGKPGPGPAVLHNSAFLLDAAGMVAASYQKMHLVPFGEYVPFKPAFFFLQKIVQSDGEFEAGQEYTLMRTRASGSDQHEVLMNTVICYEIIFPDLVRRFVSKGARVVTTMTNDAWFGNTAAPYQHFSMAVLRAVENRVPIARAANTGVSGFIDAKGRILSSSDIFTESKLTHTLSPGTTKTFYTVYGDVFSYLCMLASFMILILTQKKA